MDVADPFAPLYSNGHGTHTDEWNPVSEVNVATGSAGFGDDVAAGGLDEAKKLAAHFVETAADISRALNAADSERSALQNQQLALQEQLRYLQESAAQKEEFRNVFLQGSGAAVTADDLRALESMTAALTADPDRLTTLFAVVQQAEKLATVVRAYTELHGMVDKR